MMTRSDHRAVVVLVLLCAAVVAVLPSQARRDLSEGLTGAATPTTIGQVSWLYNIVSCSFGGLVGDFVVNYEICCS